MFLNSVLRPGAPRISGIGNHIKFPRTVPVVPVLAGFGGALVGLLIGLPLEALIPVRGGMMMVASLTLCISTSVLMVTWQPWQGESVRKTVWVTASAAAKRRPQVCPGSAQALALDPTTNEAFCEVCNTTPENVHGLAGWHEIRRSVYVGMQRIDPPVLGPVRVVPGSVPADDNRDQQSVLPGQQRDSWLPQWLSNRRTRVDIEEFEPPPDGLCGCGCGELAPRGDAAHFAVHLGWCRHLARQLRHLADSNPTRTVECEELLWTWNRAVHDFDAAIHGRLMPDGSRPLPPTGTYVMGWREQAIQTLTKP